MTNKNSKKGLKFVFLLFSTCQSFSTDLLANEDCRYDFIDEECTKITIVEMAGRFVTDAAEYNWPYLVSIQSRVRGRPDGCFNHFCGGVLVSPQLVLSAAHCAEFGSVLGPLIDEGETLREVFVSRAPKCRHQTSGQRVQVEYVWKYSNWDRSKSSGDVALLKISEPFKNYDGPYANYSSSQTFDFNMAGHLTMVGWGSSNDLELKRDVQYSVSPLKQAKVSYVSRAHCSYLLDLHGSPQATKLLDYDTMLCTYSPGADTCLGDSGGPIVKKGKIPDEDVLLGIVSWGPAVQCQSNNASQAPSVFARVSSFVPWINEILFQVEIEMKSAVDNEIDVVPKLQFPVISEKDMANLKNNQSSVPQIQKSLSSNITFIPLFFNSTRTPINSSN